MVMNDPRNHQQKVVPPPTVAVRKNNEQGALMKSFIESNSISRCSLNRSNCGSGLDETLQAVKNLLSFKKSESSSNLLKITMPIKKQEA